MKKKTSDAILKLIALMIVFSMMLGLTSCGGKIEAVTVRVLNYEGSVALVSEGKQCSMGENMLLHSGDTIATGIDSFVALSLDDTKAFGLCESCIADFIQSGKKLEVDIKKGEAYFYTTEKLEDDETFDIRTETLIVGIRGTSGYFSVDEEKKTTTFMLTSGKVHVTGQNNSTGGTRETDLEAGQVISTYLFDDKNGEDSVVFNIGSFDIDDIPDELLSVIVSDKDLLKKVAEDLGVSEEKLIDALNNKDDDEKTDPEEDQEDNESGLGLVLNSSLKPLRPEPGPNGNGGEFDPEYIEPEGDEPYYGDDDDDDDYDDDDDNPLTDDPPADDPPADDPPADDPPADDPPADNPPADNPPADNPPADNPPADNPTTSSPGTPAPEG